MGYDVVWIATWILVSAVSLGIVVAGGVMLFKAIKFAIQRRRE